MRRRVEVVLPALASLKFATFFVSIVTALWRSRGGWYESTYLVYESTYRSQSNLHTLLSAAIAIVDDGLEFFAIMRIF
ncbi:hypothetical protein TNCV_1576521 [Trichonephila clavipes]|nr:hypothetical protein TNCV_1576521 [Trichonephila clavipes]